MSISGPETFFSALPDRSVLAISGEEARVFLQGLITNDIYKVTPENAVYAALLSPQGKFLFDFFISQYGDSLLLDCEKSRMADLIKRLSMYKLRAKVQLEMLEDWAVAAVILPPLEGEGRGRGSSLLQDVPPTLPLKGGASFPDPRYAPMGWRLMAQEKMLRHAQHDAETYENHRLSHGIPDGSRDMLVDKAFALECGIDLLHGIDFNKGCYVGQEVTARTKYRGVVRKGFYKLRAAEHALPASGTSITLEGKPVGEVRSSLGGIGLGWLRHEEVANAVTHQQPLQAASSLIFAASTPWAKEPAAP